MGCKTLFLACVGVCGFTVANAGDPVTSQPASASTSDTVASQPASAPTSDTVASEAAAAAKSDTIAPQAPAAAKSTTAPAPAVDPDEQRLISQGYKPEMRHGEKVFCKREPVMGSRINVTEHCGTVDQLKTLTQVSKEEVNKSQRIQTNPTGH